MKKVCILAIAALAMLSCSNTYKPEKVELNSMEDSINFCLGLVNGYDLRMQMFTKDTTDEAFAEFIDALSRGYEGKVEEMSEVKKTGVTLGQNIKYFEKAGLMQNAAIAMNEKIFFQGLVNGLLRDTTMMTPFQSNQYFQNNIYAIRTNAQADAPDPVTATCGTTAGKIKLSNKTDSLNYTYGYSCGTEVVTYVLSQDKTKEDIKIFIDAVNEGLKTKYINPQVVAMGEKYGDAIKKQEPTGLVGVEGLKTDFELIKQGFINGLYKDTTTIPIGYMEARLFINNTISDMIARQDSIKAEKTKQEGEKFLKENATKEGVVVTESGLQYEVITMGKGAKPKATDKVKVNYVGTLIDSTEFDSSFKRNQPVSFRLNQVIAGWTEGLQLMPVGSKFKFYIPQELGYGNRPSGVIPACSALIFEVELLEIEKEDKKK